MKKLYLLATSLIFATMINVSYLTRDSDKIWKHFDRETHKSIHDSNPNKAADTSNTQKSTQFTSESDPVGAHVKLDSSDPQKSAVSTIDSNTVWAHNKPEMHTKESTNDSDPIWAHFKPKILSPPTIIIKSSNVYKCVERADKLLKIPCETTGQPEPIITWKLNNTVISNDYKYSVEDGVLIIKNPIVRDSQSYTCEASNEAGSVSATFQAEVLQRPRVRGSIFPLALVGKPIAINCWITKGIPKPEITWEFMPEGGSKYVSLQNSGNVLNIPDVNVNHAGYYKCTARNSVGESSHRVALDVQSPPIIITNSSVIYKGVQGNDEMLRVPCVATGRPDPDISWHFNGLASAEESKYSIDENGTLVITNLTVSDSQMYTCKARNEAGSSSETFRVKILPENMDDTTSLFRQIFRSVIARWFGPTPEKKTPLVVKMGPRCIQNQHYCGLKCRMQYDKCIEQTTGRNITLVEKETLFNW